MVQIELMNHRWDHDKKDINVDSVPLQQTYDCAWLIPPPSPTFLAGTKRTALQVSWSQVPNTKLSITHTFFKLEAQNFAW